MAESPWIGRSLNNRYQIESMLGQGGMSAVFKANDPNLKRTVAVKLIHAHLTSDESFLQRFKEEATAVASLRHPNIIQVYDFNSDENTYYMVLEYVEGETLHQRLRRLNQQGQKLPIDEAIRYTLNICDALGYAHNRGMIHRDIKPGNIMVDTEGQAILMDFGIVKILGGTSHTSTGTIVGTASYIPPEVVKSEPADQRSDIYSLGITLYEMISGDIPFRADSTISMMMMHVNSPVPDPRLVRPGLPPTLVQTLYKSLEKDPNNRYQNTAEMAVDLKKALDEIGSSRSAKTAVFQPPVPQQPSTKTIPQAPPPTLPPSTLPPLTTPPNKPANLNCLWVLGAGLILFFLILLVGGGLLFFRRQMQRANLPPTSPSSALSQDSPTPPLQATATALAAASSTRTFQPTATLEASMPGMAANSTTDPNATPSTSPFSAKITGISIVGTKYVVQFEVHGFVPKLPGGTHVHFYFNNVAPEDAGMPGPGPWKMFGGTQTFNGYSVSQRPEGVTQMCVIVANADHTVIQGSGNCFDLP